jgi:hypothetical protein
MSGATHPSAFSASFCIIEEQQREQQQQQQQNSPPPVVPEVDERIHLNKIEKFHVHKQAATRNHLNDDHTLTNNIIFYTILKDFAMHNQ